MPAAVRVNATTASATATDTISTGTFNRASGILGGIYALVAYNADFVTGPATDADFAGEPLSLLAGVTRLGNVSVEIWGATSVVANSGVITVNFAGGSIYDILLSVVDVDRVGKASAPNVQAATDTGSTSPVTISLTTGATQGGRKATIVIPVEENLMLGIGAMFKAGSASNLSLTSGITIMAPTDVGTSPTVIQVATARQDCTGGSDTISWSESINRDWCAAAIEIAGAAADGMILRPGGGVLPTLF